MSYSCQRHSLGGDAHNDVKPLGRNGDPHGPSRQPATCAGFWSTSPERLPGQPLTATAQPLSTELPTVRANNLRPQRHLQLGQCVARALLTRLHPRQRVFQLCGIGVQRRIEGGDPVDQAAVHQPVGSRSVMRRRACRRLEQFDHGVVAQGRPQLLQRMKQRPVCRVVRRVAGRRGAHSMRPCVARNLSAAEGHVHWRFSGGSPKRSRGPGPRTGAPPGDFS